MYPALPFSRHQVAIRDQDQKDTIAKFSHIFDLASLVHYTSLC